MGDQVTVLTDRGQVSVPASVRRDMAIRPGQKLRWEKVSDRECRVTVLAPGIGSSAKAMRGFVRRIHPQARTTAQWMAELRGGEH